MNGTPVIEVYTRKWKGDRAAKPGEDHDLTLNCRVFVEGEELPYVNGITASADDGFGQVFLQVLAKEVRFIALNAEEWDAL